MKYNIEQIRQAVLDAADSEWRKNIRDDGRDRAGRPVPGDRALITRYFEHHGWSRHLPEGGYRENAGAVAWCGHFQGFIHQAIGDYIEPGMCVPLTLDPGIAQFCLPSTQRMHYPGKWRAAGSTMPAYYMADVDDTHAWIARISGDPTDPADIFLPGVVATMVTREYGDARDDVGGHFVTVVSFDRVRHRVETIEGNAVGELHNGTWTEGVVRRRGEHARSLDDFRCVWHFDLSHFELLDI